MEEEFSWHHMNLYFPEYSKEPLHQEELFEDFSKGEPTYSNGAALFRTDNDYMIGLYFKDKIPSWANNSEINQKYSGLSKKVFSEVLEEVEKSMEILESWRPFLKKFDDKRGWEGNLQSTLYFEKLHSKTKFSDYFHLFSNPSTPLKHPMEIFSKINKIPLEMLNDEFKTYHHLGENIYTWEGKTAYLVDESISGALKKANEIYSLKDKLLEIRETAKKI